MAQVDVFSVNLFPKSASSVSRPELNATGRVSLPAMVLDAIAPLRMVYPLQFKITSKRGSPIFAAVLDFTAEMGTVVMPDWMYAHMQSAPKSVVVETCSLRAAGLVRLQPHLSDFIKLSDPRRVLEEQLANYPVLFKGSAIAISHVGRLFIMNVEELYDASMKPIDAALTARADAKATELKLEFGRPLDMPPSPVKSAAATTSGANVIGGASGIHFNTSAFTPPTLDGATAPDVSTTAEAPATSSFVAFGGEGRSMGGGEVSSTGRRQISETDMDLIRAKRLAALRGR